MPASYFVAWIKREGCVGDEKAVKNVRRESCRFGPLDTGGL